MNIGGSLDTAAMARMHFNLLEREDQEAAIRRMAMTGWSEYTIANATGLSVVAVQRVLGEHQAVFPP